MVVDRYSDNIPGQTEHNSAYYADQKRIQHELFETFLEEFNRILHGGNFKNGENDPASEAKGDSAAAVAFAIAVLLPQKFNEYELNEEEKATQIDYLNKFVKDMNRIKDLISEAETNSDPALGAEFKNLIASLQSKIDADPAWFQSLSDNIKKPINDITALISQYEKDGFNPLNVIWDLASGLQPQISVDAYKGGVQFALDPATGLVTTVTIPCPNQEVFDVWRKSTGAPVPGCPFDPHFDPVNHCITVDVSQSSNTPGVSQDWLKQYCQRWGVSDQGQGILAQAINIYNQNHSGRVDPDSQPLNKLLGDLSTLSTATSNISSQVQVSNKAFLADYQTLMSGLSSMQKEWIKQMKTFVEHIGR